MHLLCDTQFCLHSLLSQFIVLKYIFHYNIPTRFFWLSPGSDYAVKEKPLMVGDMEGGADYIVLKTLDTDGVRIIGRVLGQSIALDYFVSQVYYKDFSVMYFTKTNLF